MISMKVIILHAVHSMFYLPFFPVKTCLGNLAGFNVELCARSRTVGMPSKKRVLAQGYLPKCQSLKCLNFFFCKKTSHCNKAVLLSQKPRCRINHPGESLVIIKIEMERHHILYAEWVNISRDFDLNAAAQYIIPIVQWIDKQQRLGTLIIFCCFDSIGNIII